VFIVVVVVVVVYFVIDSVRKLLDTHSYEELVQLSSIVRLNEQG
jgi:hypothetical protein